MADSKMKQAGAKLFDKLYGTASGKLALNDAAMSALAQQQGVNLDDLDVDAYVDYVNNNENAINAIKSKITSNPLARKVSIADGSDVTVNPLKTTASSIWGGVKAHPWQTAGTALNATGNVAGLVDNDKLLGQLVGTAGGAILGTMVPGMKGLGIANMAMGGGNIGMLFDKLRAKKEQEEQYQQQYY